MRLGDDKPASRNWLSLVVCLQIQCNTVTEIVVVITAAIKAIYKQPVRRLKNNSFIRQPIILINAFNKTKLLSEIVFMLTVAVMLQTTNTQRLLINVTDIRQLKLRKWRNK